MTELERMAARGEEDGHDRKWHSAVAADRRDIDAMGRAATAAKTALQKHEDEEWARITKR